MPPTTHLANCPQQAKSESREQQNIQVENRLRVKAEEGVAREQNQLEDRDSVSLDILPEPCKINRLGTGHGGDEKPIFPARSAVTIKSHEAECHHGQEQPDSEDEPATPRLIGATGRQHASGPLPGRGRVVVKMAISRGKSRSLTMPSRFN